MQTARGYSLGAVDYILSPVVPEILRSKVGVFVSLYLMQRQVERQADARAAMMASEAARRLAEENDRRSAFLAAASQALNRSLDIRVAMQELVALLVPARARLALVWIARSGTRARLVRDRGPPRGRRAGGGRFRHRAGAVRGGHGGAAGSGEPAPGQGGRRGDAAGAGRAGASRRRSRRAGWPPSPRCRCCRRARAGRPAGGVARGRRLDARGRPDPGAGGGDAGGAAFENARLYRNLQHEIVERQAAQQELQQASQRKDEFLAMLSHELRNPLASVHTAIEVIRRVADKQPKVTWALDLAGRQLRQITRLMEELLDVTRISQGKITLKCDPVDLRVVVAHSIETVHQLLESRRQMLAWPCRKPDLGGCRSARGYAGHLPTCFTTPRSTARRRRRIELRWWSRTRASRSRCATKAWASMKSCCRASSISSPRASGA